MELFFQVSVIKKRKKRKKRNFKALIIDKIYIKKKKHSPKLSFYVSSGNDRGGYLNRKEIVAFLLLSGCPRPEKGVPCELAAMFAAGFLPFFLLKS